MELYCTREEFFLSLYNTHLFYRALSTCVLTIRHEVIQSDMEDPLSKLIPFQMILNLYWVYQHKGAFTQLLLKMIKLLYNF